MLGCSHCKHNDVTSSLCSYVASVNTPRSIHQYSNMATRLSGQTSIFGVVFFVSKSLLGIVRQKKFKQFTILAQKPRSHVRILIYLTQPTEIKKLLLNPDNSNPH